MADGPITLGQLGAQYAGPDPENLHPAPALGQDPGLMGRIASGLGYEPPKLQAPLAKPLGGALQAWGLRQPPGQEPAAPTGPSPAPAYGGGYGPMPKIEPEYYEGGPEAEAQRIEARFATDREGLQQRLYGESPEGIITPAQYQQSLGALQGAKTKALAQVAARAASPRGTLESIQRSRIAGQQAQYQSAMDIGRTEQQQAEQQAGAIEQARQSAESQQREMDQRRRDYDAAFSQRLGEFDIANKRISKTSIDPDRWWKNRSTGQKVLATIAMAAGGWLQGAHGGPNYNAELIQKQVESDIMAQRADIENRRAGLAAQGSLLGQMRSHYGDMQSATLATKQHIYSQLALQTQGYAATAQSERAKVQLSALSGAMQRAGFEAEQGLKLQAQADAEAKTMLLAGQRAAAARAGQPEWTPLSPEQRKMYVPGAGGFAKDAAAATDIADSDAAHRDLKDAMELQTQLMDSPMVWMPGTEAYSKAEANHARLVMLANRAAKLGALDRGAQELLTKMIPDATAWYRTATAGGGMGNAKATLQQAIALADQSFANQMAAKGIAPANVQQRYDDKGRLQLMQLRAPGEVGAAEKKLDVKPVE